MDFIKIKNFCSSRNTIKGMKRQTTEQDNTIASHISVVGFVYATHNEITKLNKETNDPIFLNGLKYRYPTKEEICMVNLQMTRNSISFTTIEMQIKSIGDTTVHWY